MTAERWEQIEELYHAALEQPLSGRAAYLAGVCAGDDELRREIDSLLASHEQAADFIEKPPEDVAAGMIVERQSGPPSGRRLGRYTLHSRIGAGGMGEVYRARDTRLDRDVAIKILPEHLATDSDALRRFEREAKAVAALSHPNITAIFDFGTENGVNYAVMELLEGETLRSRLAGGPLDWRRAVAITIAVAEGLAAAHSMGIIHRDLKPENIFLTHHGQVKILDFGIARVKKPIAAGAPDAETLTSIVTMPGTVMGTIGYMSPEQVRGEVADAPSDLFSLGCLTYEMLSGRRPFDRPSAAETMAAILTAEPPSLRQRMSAIPKALERILDKALRKDLTRRYQTAAELLVDLKELPLVLQGQTVPVVLKRGPIPWQTPAAIGALVLVLTVGLALRFYWQRPLPAVTSNVTVNHVTPAKPARIEALWYSLEVKSADHEWKRISGSAPMAAGQQFRFRFTPRMDGYLYLIATGRQNTPTTFLTAQPTRSTGVPTNRLVTGIEFIFPGAGNSIEVRNFGTVNRYTVIFSPAPLPQPAFLTARAERQLTAAEQSELESFLQQYNNPAPELEPDSAGEQVLVTVPQDHAAAPLVFDIFVRRR